MASHKIIFGDSREMVELENESVHFIVTSPPYWSIKDYDHEGQIGFGQSYEEYLSDLKMVISECHRVLCRGCRMALNIGDQYLRAAAEGKGRYRVQPIPADLIKMAQEIDFDFMGNIIWKKISTTKTTGGGQWMGSIYYPKDGHITYEHEYIIILRKKGKWPKPTKEQNEKSKLTKEQRSSWFRGMWEIFPERQKAHVAMFPIEVPQRLIKMYSFHDETVLDPFLGSGTTVKAAHIEGRNSVGYEINREFEPLIKDRLGISTGDMFDDLKVEFKYR